METHYLRTSSCHTAYIIMSGLPIIYPRRAIVIIRRVLPPFYLSEQWTHNGLWSSRRGRRSGLILLNGSYALRVDFHPEKEIFRCIRE